MNLGMRLGSIFFGIVAFAYGTLAIAVLGFFASGFVMTPKPEAVQRGYRRTGLVVLYNAQALKQTAAASAIPPPIPDAGDEGAKAGTIYNNPKVLGEVPVGEFTRLMVSMARWVAPSQGCAACHNVTIFRTTRSTPRLSRGACWK